MDLLIEPLLDFEGRVICLSPRTPVSVFIDRLLRLHSAPAWRDPITLYLAGADDVGASPQRTLSALEFLQLHSIFKSLRSRLDATALGLLTGFEPLVLASCAKGKRCMLPTAMACVGPLEIGDLPLSNAIGLGNRNHNGPSLRDQAHALVQAQLDHILDELNLAPGLWRAPCVLTADLAISMGLADAIVPIHTPALHQQEKRDSQAIPQSYGKPRQFQRDQR